MIECPYCYRVFRQAPEKMGARCPKCRMPLYEDVSKRRKGAERDYGPCAQHPEAAAITKCSRCEALLCQACRTRWQGEVVCPQCVDHSIADDEPSPQEAQMQTRQAWYSVILAAAAWMLLMLTLAPYSTFHQQQVMSTMVFGTYLFYLGSFLPGLFGVGLGVAAIRLRGDHRILATCGLIGSGSQLGIAIGIMVLNLWHN
jgi:hypothetical protein